MPKELQCWNEMFMAISFDLSKTMSVCRLFVHGQIC
jgi:hypothetical protein